MSRSKSSNKRRKLAEEVTAQQEEEPVTGEYVVSEIVDHFGNPNNRSLMRFKVHWEGYSSKSDTWEPWSHVADLIHLEKYIEKHPELAILSSSSSSSSKPVSKAPASSASTPSSSNRRNKAVFPSVTKAEKEMIFDQLQKLFLKVEVQRSRLELLLQEYFRFISLKVAKPSVSYQPCPDVDMMWHAHIICTRQYHDFCARCNNGNYIHHTPERQNNTQAYKNTLSAYREMFGNPDYTFWGGASAFEVANTSENNEDDIKSYLSEASEAADENEKETWIDIYEFDPTKIVEKRDIEIQYLTAPTLAEKVVLCEQNAMRKLKIIFDFAKIKYKADGNGSYHYSGRRCVSGPGCSSNAILLCRKCLHVWEFGTCGRTLQCLKCENNSGAIAKASSSMENAEANIDYIVSCFGCG